MSRMIDITEIVGTFHRQDRKHEICAVAEGDYDETRSALELRLDSFVRPVDLRHTERHLRENWLPPAETVREGVAWEDSSRLAKEIFGRWVVKLRQHAQSFANTQPENAYACKI